MNVYFNPAYGCQTAINVYVWYNTASYDQRIKDFLTMRYINSLLLTYLLSIREMLIDFRI